MTEPMTKSRLLEIVRARRAEYDAALAKVPQEHMTEGGAAGYWSIKDIVAHLTYYESWMADRLHEQLDGKGYTPGPLDFIHWEERNKIIYERTKDQPLAEVLEKSRLAFERLVTGIEAHSESFLTEPQQFEGAPQPIIVWNMIRSEVYDHYPQHIPDIQASGAG